MFAIVSEKQRLRSQKKSLEISPIAYTVFFVLGGTAGHLGFRRGGLHLFWPLPILIGQNRTFIPYKSLDLAQTGGECDVGRQ
jgi:hypothetical protein